MAITHFLRTFASMNEFSLLMSVYNGEKAEYLTECFDSIYKQTVRPTEIVLVEDGQLNDSLREAIKREEQRFPMMKRVVLKQNCGLGVALSEGMKACTYDLIARMDTDDICSPNRFEVQLSYMQEHPEIDVLGAWITEFDHEPSNTVGVRCPPESHEAIYKFGKMRNPTNHPVVMFRRQSVLDAGGYLPSPLFEDYYLWARMLVKGYRFHNLQQSLLLFRRSPEMIHRRGGLSYAQHEMALLKKLREMGYISTYGMARNIAQRYVVRILPNFARGFVYRHLLRTKP